MPADPAADLRALLAERVPVPPDAAHVREAAGVDLYAVASVFEKPARLVAAWEAGTKTPKLTERLAWVALIDALRGEPDRFVADVERFLSDPTTGTDTAEASGG